nr:hypothetical protein [Tanacetum cinerariifolium]
MGDKIISTTPVRENDEFIKSSVDDFVPIPRESEVTSVSIDLECGNSDSMPRSYDVTFSNPLFYFNYDYTLYYDNLLFDEEFVDISSLDPPESTLDINESSLLVTPPSASKQLSLKEVERFDMFFSLTQSGKETRVMEIPSFVFIICHHPILLHSHQRR